MRIRNVVVAVAASVVASAVVTLILRRLGAAGRDPIAAAPPRVTDFRP